METKLTKLTVDDESISLRTRVIGWPYNPIDALWHNRSAVGQGTSVVGGGSRQWTARAKDQRMTKSAAVQRAFTLARSGQCRSVAEIIRRLSEQDRAAVEAHLSAPSARRELILICSNAWLEAR